MAHKQESIAGWQEQAKAYAKAEREQVESRNKQKQVLWRKIDIEKYYPSITHEQLLEAISKQLYNDYFTKTFALVRGDYIQQAEELEQRIKGMVESRNKLNQNGKAL